LNASRDRDRQWRPRYAVWEVTLACDLACRHCGSRAGRARPDELSPSEALDLVDQLAALGVMEVTLIGGEAYLREDFVDIARRVRGHGMSCTMTTGARGIDRARAQAIKASGIESVSVSIDGLRETHDALRGVRGSFDAAFAAMGYLREAGVHVAANTQIGRASLRDIPHVFDLLAAARIHSWQFQLTVAMGRASDEPDLVLEPYQVLEVMPMLARLKSKADAANVRLWPGNNIGYFGPYESMLRGTLPRGHLSSCGAGRSTIGIEANGNIKGCPSLTSREYVGGNVRDHALVDIWERATELRFTRDRTVDELWGGCRGCYYADECRGGCTWTSQVLFGRSGNNPFCHHRALELLRQGKRERLRRTAPAPGLPFDHATFEIVEEAWPAATIDRARALAATGEGWLDD
jgi:radical SAM protein with 4Fe4S-binding SPASM domain